MQRILIVDDNEENLYYLQALLRSTEYEVNTARNGAEALNAALADPPELVISDLLMPIMDGFTLLRQWKAEQRLNRIPFVVYTATYTDPKDEQLALDLGADAFIVKPTEPTPFMDKIRAVLEKAARGDMSPANALVGKEKDILRQYSEVLIHKLESKALELEEANRELSVRETHLKAIIENSPNCITLIAPDGTFLTMNEAGLRMLETDSAETIVGKCSYEVIVPEYRNAFRDLTERVCRGESGSIEYEIEGLKGTRRWLELYAAPLKDSAEKRTVLLGIAQDTTGRKLAEAMRAADREKLEVALASMVDAVFITDASGQLIHVNKAFARFHRLSDKEVLAGDSSRFRKIIDLLAADGTPLPDDMSHTQRALRGESGTNLEYAVRHRETGETWFASYNFSPLRDNRGAIIGCVVVARDITTQRVAEQKLRESERELSLVFKNISDVVFNLAVEPDGQFRFVSVNPAFLRATGLETGQVVGKLAQEVIPEPSRSLVLEKYQEAVRERKTVFWEETSAYPVGEKHAEVFVSPAFNERGQCVNLIGVLHDITEHRREQKHIEHLNRVYSVLSNINETIVRVKDSQAMLEAACRIAVEEGKFRMAWIGMADPAAGVLIPIASSGVVEDYLKRVRIDLQNPKTASGPAARCFHSGKHQVCNDIEHELYRPWKEYALQLGYRSLISFPLCCEGQTIGVFNLYASELAFFNDHETKLLDEMAMDISFALEVNRHEKERQKAEAELRWRTAFFEANIDSSLDGILVVDSMNTKILQNQRMNELMNIPREIAEELDDARQREFVCSIVKDPDHFTEKVDYLNSHPDEVSRDEVELLNGVIFDRYSAPVRDKLNNYYGRIWTFRDITQQRQLEGQLRQAQKMEAVGQLTGGIAHDFNNLLTVILGCSEFIGEEVKENPRLSKMAQMILDAARRGADLTHRMLAYARRQALQPKPIDVNRMLANMESFLRRTLSADIDLEVIQSRKNYTALVDLTQLESALLNLCVNARDAMPGGGKLIVETGMAELDASYAEQNPDVTPGHYILIAVSDTGCGISPENLERVFDPFFTTKEVGKGTGLGLSMVYGFAKQSQGNVKIYSEPGHGTSVKLYLPMADQKSEPSNQESILIADLRGLEIILLVEDNAPVREFAKTQLLYLGYQVLEAANGKDALAMLREHPEIELLFTDVVMPGGLNGRELALEARKLYPALKVLFTSGYAESAILDMGLLDEHIQLLNKPYSRLQLARRIREVLTTSPSAPEEEGRNA
jgi:PAS domain S-box-containing protein